MAPTASTAPSSMPRRSPRTPIPNKRYQCDAVAQVRVSKGVIRSKKTKASISLRVQPTPFPSLSLRRQSNPDGCHIVFTTRPLSTPEVVPFYSRETGRKIATFRRSIEPVAGQKRAGPTFKIICSGVPIKEVIVRKADEILLQKQADYVYAVLKPLFDDASVVDTSRIKDEVPIKLENGASTA